MNKRLTVLFISPASDLYGSQQSLLLLLKYINRSRINPIVIIPTDGPLNSELKCLQIKTYIIRCPWWYRKYRNYFWSLFQFIYCLSWEIITAPRLLLIIAGQKVDVIYTNSLHIFSGAISALIAHKKHVWHIRDLLSDNPALRMFLPKKLQFDLVVRLSNIVIGNSNTTVDQFSQYSYTNKLEMVYNAVEIAAVDSESSFPAIDGFSVEDWGVAVIGVLSPIKGHDDAIRAIAIANKTIPNIKLLLVGTGQPGYVNLLKQIAADMNVTDNIIFTGFRNDVSLILSHCKVLLVSSWHESFGRTTIEAMAACKPVIGVNCGGTKEIIEDGITGYLVPPHDYHKMAEKLIYLYGHPDEISRMGQNGRLIVADKFYPAKYVSRIESIIADIYCQNK